MKFIGLTYDTQSATEYLTTIDSNTGVVTPVGTGLPGVAAVFDGEQIATGGTFYFGGINSTGTNFLYAVNEATGQLIASLPSSASSFAIDDTTGALVGLSYDSQSATEYLTSIDSNSGVVKFVGTGLPGVASVFEAEKVAIGGTLYFEGTNSTGVNLLYAANEASGQLIASVPSSASDFVVDPGTVQCFSTGTGILTIRGEVSVEELSVGSILELANGGTRPVVWIGHRSIDCRRHSRPTDVWPIGIRAHAFGAGKPHTDLFLSPDHAVFLNGSLLPIKSLVNGTTIAQERADKITYYHVELGVHEVIVAHGLPCESYLDIDDRTCFGNYDATMLLFPELAPASATRVMALREARGCAPLVIRGPALDTAREFVNAQITIAAKIPVAA